MNRCPRLMLSGVIQRGADPWPVDEGMKSQKTSKLEV